LPFEVLNDRPLGKLGVTENAIDPTPPEAETGKKLAVSVNLISVVVGTATVTEIAGGCTTSRLSTFELVCPSKSVTVIVKSVAVVSCVGVPDIDPVCEFIVSP
jgi:hypothetical protein